MIHDGLTCAFAGVHMGTYGNKTAKEYEITRDAQDEWALRSHERAIKATMEGIIGGRNCRGRSASTKRRSGL